MLNSKRAFVAITATLGPLVPASYVWSARQWPEHTQRLWGSIAGAARTAYTTNMLFATAGYLLFSWWFWRHAQADTTNSEGTRFLTRFGSGAVNLGYFMVLVGSIAWMPLSLYALANEVALMGVIVGVLMTVAAGSLLLAACLFTATPPAPQPALLRARIGVVFFCIQTVVLDAIIWPLAFSL